MGSLTHERICQIIGICFDRHPKQIIVEFMGGGDMTGFLSGQREACKTIRQVGLPLLVQMSSDVAEGMEFLEQLGCVHRDLAARNCLLDDDLRAKVTDFGLSRELYRTVYYQQVQPRQLYLCRRFDLDRFPRRCLANHVPRPARVSAMVLLPLRFGMSPGLRAAILWPNG